MKPVAIAVVSGGMDSVTMAYLLHAQGYDTHILSFYYGQLHSRELYYAELTANKLETKFDIIDLSSVGEQLTGNALTDNIAVPDGHYAEESMRITVVPNRNAIMLAVAFGVAVSRNAELVATAVHGGDHYIYPDCRPSFISAFNTMQRYAVAGFGNPNLTLYTPFIEFGKHDIVTVGAGLGVDFTESWSCYKGGAEHCGTCGTCVERKEAFTLANIFDPTVYSTTI